MNRDPDINGLRLTASTPSSGAAGIAALSQANPSARLALDLMSR